MGETLVWDTEARNSPTGVLGEDERWPDYMKYSGISVAVVWSLDTKEFDFYSDRDIGENGLIALSERLAAADAVVSYCGDYDRTVLENCLDISLTLNECDLHQVIREKVGWNSNTWPAGSWKLGRVSRDTLGITKTADGAMAPSMIANEHYAQLYKYCMQDVVCTRDLWLFILKYGYVIGPQGRKWEVKISDTSGRSKKRRN